MDCKDIGIIECLWQKLNSFVLGKGNEQHIFTSWIRGDGSGIHVVILKISCLKGIRIHIKIKWILRTSSKTTPCD